MRILFVALAQSVHTARWIDAISDQGWDLHLFPADDVSIPWVAHPELRKLTVYDSSVARLVGLDKEVRVRTLWPFAWSSSRVQALERLRLPGWPDRATWLAWLIRWLKPDILHSQEFQHAAYLTLAAKSKLKRRFPTWVVSNWGSDICLFGRLSEHVDKIRSVLASCDYYDCECQRDVRLARELGFRGEVLPVLPNAGGFDLNRLGQLRQPGPTSARRVIALKGYQGWAYRALVGLRAIELCADALDGYRVVVYLASPATQIAIQRLRRSIDIPIEVLPYGPQEDALRLHGRARISIGLNISDAISTSFLEAMVMGSFPIQSNTGCADEWVMDGGTAFLVHPEDPEAVAAAIRRAVADDALVGRAAQLNARTGKERLDQSLIRPQIVKLYEQIGARARQGTARTAS